MSKKVMYKSCVVPECKSSTVRTPNKLFFSIPPGEEKRSEWCRAMGRHQPEHRPLHPHSSRFCCEDHFDLENDMANYLKWKLVGTSRLSLKKGVLPHKFDCQNRMSSETRSPVENSLHIKKELQNNEKATSIWSSEAFKKDPPGIKCKKESALVIKQEPDLWNCDVTESIELRETNENSDFNSDDNSDNAHKPYIVNIIYVKTNRMSNR